MRLCEVRGCTGTAVALVNVKAPTWNVAESRRVCARHRADLTPTEKNVETVPTVEHRYLETIAGGLGDTILHVLEVYQVNGKILSTVDLDFLSQFLTRNERIQFLNFIYLREMSITELGEAVRKDVTFVLTPLLTD